MQVRKIIQKRIRGALAGDRNAAVAINVGERGVVTKVSSSQSTSGEPRAEKDAETG